jgi:hypothetical protein
MAVNRLAVLGIAVDPTKAVAGARRAGMAIKSVGQTAANVKNRIFSLQGALVALGGGLVIRSFLNTASSLEKLKVQLKTVTGSANNADKAFDRLVEFTTRTPYEIDQVVTAFTKLKAFGLDPSEEAMTSFGNTASAMGKDLDQMIEAVADAATGEFERLKEFGIKSSKQGDLVKFTFQGMTTEVKNSSEAIQGYIMDIGNNQFGGAMADQMSTFEGAMSNFRGSWSLFQDELMNNGPFDILKGLVNAASDSLFGTSGSLSSNAAAAGQSIANFIEYAALGIAGFTDNMLGYVDAIWGKVSGLWDEFLKLPSEVQTVGIIGAFLGGLKIKIFIGALLAGLAKIRGSMAEIKAALGEDILFVNQSDSLEELTAAALGYEKQIERMKSLGSAPFYDVMSANQLSILESLGGSLEDQEANLNAIRVRIIQLQSLAATGLEFPENENGVKSMGLPTNVQTKDDGSLLKGTKEFFRNIKIRNAFALRENELMELVKQEDAITAAEVTAAAKVKAFSGSMGEISALHRNAQQEMSDASAHFEERNAELHAAAMARKSEAFNVFKEHFNEGWTEMEEKSVPILERMADKLLSIFGPDGTFAKGIGDATADMIIFGKSGADAMKALGRTIMHQVVSSLISMGVQTAVNFAKERVFGAAGAAAAVTQAGIIAAAYAPAAAAVSLATLGANAVSANVGMASSFALAKGLSLTGARERGGPVERSGTYLVGEKGPELFSPNQSGNITSNKNMGAANTANVTFNINAIDTSDATRLIMGQRGTIIGVINQALNERGRAALV